MKKFGLAWKKLNGKCGRNRGARRDWDKMPGRGVTICPREPGSRNRKTTKIAKIAKGEERASEANYE